MLYQHFESPVNRASPAVKSAAHAARRDTTTMFSRRLITGGRLSHCAALACCALFLVSGFAILPYPGIQNDEALFAAPLFFPQWMIASIHIAGLHIPTMQMSYLGCLKAWVYKPIFSIWSPSVYSIRIPALLLGAGTIYLFWLLLRRTSGDRAALIGTILLATDTSFLLTTCFDWGPVALQHFLMVGGVLALVSFHQSGKEPLLGLGFFLFGLGLWDKAIFSWTLAGIAVATLPCFPRELWKIISWRRVLISLVFFLIGAFPLVWYNLKQNGKTFTSNANFSLHDTSVKLAALRKTTNGSAFFGYLVASPQPHSLREARTAVQRSAVILAHTMPENTNFTEFGFALAILMLPFLWRTGARKPLLFALLLMALVWFQMAITVGAGTGPHHVVLIWPWPMFLIAVAFSHAESCLPRVGKSAVIVVVAFLALTNVLLTNQYLARLIQSGPGPVWTDAIFPLAEYLQHETKVIIYSTDWGTTNSLRLLDRGALRLQEATFILLKDTLDKGDRQFLFNMMARSNSLLIGHMVTFEAFPNIGARLTLLASSCGFYRQPVTTILDQEGRAVFEVFKFETSGSQKATASWGATQPGTEKEACLEHPKR